MPFPAGAGPINNLTGVNGTQRAHPLLPEDALRPPMDALDFGEGLWEMVAVTPATIEAPGCGIARSPLLFAGLRATEPWLVMLPPPGSCLPLSASAADDAASAAAPGRGSSCAVASRDVPDRERLATAAAAAARVPSLSELLDLFFICSNNAPHPC